MSIHPSINSLILYLESKEETLNLDNKFIALRDEEYNVYRNINDAKEYFERLRSKGFSLLGLENEFSYTLMYFESDNIKYISKIKINDSSLESVVVERLKDTKSVKLEIEYDGSNFNGSQRLDDKFRTVQKEIEVALNKMLKRDVEIKLASRTDKGVHAKRQVVSFDSYGISPSKYLYSLNLILPSDIRVIDAQSVSQLFDARFDTVRKRYEYVVDTGEYSVFKSKYVLFDKINNLDLINNELSVLIGTHDFSSFEKGSKDNSVRTIYVSKLEKRDNEYVFVFEGNGFLHNMIRFIVGSVLDIDKNGGSLKEILDSSDKNLTSHLASPSGLYLMRVDY